VRSLDAPVLAALLRGCKRTGCTLYGVLAASALRVSVETFQKRPSGVLGLLAFRDLRRRVVPPFAPDDGGACFSMVRHLVEVTDGSDWDVATDLSAMMATSGRRGDAFLANFVAPYLLAAAIPMRMRLADVAVSLPVLRWPAAPFVSRVHRCAGFVSSFPLAPPISIVAARCPAGLSLSFVFLDSELERAEVDRIADAVLERLATAAGCDRPSMSDQA
jgi:hypothetical protein